MARVSSGIPVLATSHRAVPASHARIKLSREPRYPPSLESGILGVRPCGGVRSALILDPAIDAPGLTGPMGAGSVSGRCKITRLYSSAAFAAFRGIERGFVQTTGAVALLCVPLPPVAERNRLATNCFCPACRSGERRVDDGNRDPGFSCNVMGTGHRQGVLASADCIGPDRASRKRRRALHPRRGGR